MNSPDNLTLRSIAQRCVSKGGNAHLPVAHPSRRAASRRSSGSGKCLNRFSSFPARLWGAPCRGASRRVRNRHIAL